MKKFFLFIAVLPLITLTAYSQEVEQQVQKTVATIAEQAAKQQADSIHWKSAGVAGITLSQVSLTNWAAGGEPSLAFEAVFNYGLDYLNGRNLWSNRLELAFGMSNTATNGTRKTNDKIYLSSNYGYAVAQSLYLGGMLTFNSQFANGFNYAVSQTDYISRFMAPGYLTVGAGLIWTPRKWFKITYNPASLKETFVLDEKLSDEGAYGVEAGTTVLTQLGSNLVAEFSLQPMKNITLYSRLDLYSNYLKNPQNIVIRWDTQVAYKLNKWFSATFNSNLIYDDNIMIAFPDGSSHQAVQFKEIFGIGLQVQF